MKLVPECKRVCIVDTRTAQVAFIFSDEYNKHLTTQDILCVIYNPYMMTWDNTGELWLNNGYMKFEVHTQYIEVEEWFDKFFRWLGGLI